MSKRDGNIVKNYKREVNLQTKVIKDKTKYTRKDKHKNQYKDYQLKDLLVRFLGGCNLTAKKQDCESCHRGSIPRSHTRKC